MVVAVVLAAAAHRDDQRAVHDRVGQVADRGKRHRAPGREFARLVIVADVSYFESQLPDGLVTRLLRAACS